MAPNVSGLPAAMAPQAATKTMSSRLMTMKFMQRGAATSESSSPTTPKSDPEGSAKRRKTSHGGPVEPSPTAAKSKSKSKLKSRSKSIAAPREAQPAPLYGEEDVKAALEEERKREAAIEKRAMELGDARWVLDGPLPLAGGASRSPLKVLQVGFAQIDSVPGDGNGSDDDAAREDGVTPSANLRRYNMATKDQARLVFFFLFLFYRGILYANE